jgi:diketogulonate reductase-like aldo/keto reductase
MLFFQTNPVKPDNSYIEWIYHQELPLIMVFKMPLLGLGVFQLKEGQQVENAVKTALINGYRSIDTAYV